jgi:hypothetical protein
VVDHPLDVPLSIAHLLFFLAFPFPLEPALHTKARAKVRDLALKGDFVFSLSSPASSCCFTVAPRSARWCNVLFHRCWARCAAVCCRGFRCCCRKRARASRLCARGTRFFFVICFTEPLIVWCLSACWSSRRRILISSLMLTPSIACC